MSAPDLQAFLAREFPDIDRLGILVERVDERSITLRLPAESAMIRPGGTISGPTMFSLADVTVWLLILAQIGPVALAVTTSVGMNFLRKPPPGDLVAEGELLKLGRRLAIGHVRLHAEGSRDLVADASITYSIPPRG
ncbi:MAG: PaaI family thioesterase [Actinomycetales bacterium]|jgi:uncharacterized protein (TIGR00369 family)|uniref:PaaI family thioesterase n=1 Tax=Candidatus Phosphoribacter hodrii TaxID=2953743 RepID=A0A935M4N6_9MICO|nr:PaaI family thioesterase [Candidatus Phosphoribacter hodrii]OPZ55323.1 MAG: Thioesterase superfamily protein [bacterium ADurb.BinA028]HNV13767.1 PaaI family thioesterase [Dermatophilaceae bacterium]HOA03659.1 PaaI family thioesterase [Dermatophilaceae bacterium]HOA57190.1 PaaI family thioesterase [Dermatophilaceae bacterium]